ncbi:MAG: hypothetical protein ACEPOV_11100 [Hyphomicrobiales bacterium]
MEEDSKQKKTTLSFNKERPIRRLKTSFAHPTADKDIFEYWKDYIGLWESESYSILIVPRKRRIINEEDFSSISAFIIDDKEDDQVLWFPETNKENKKGLYFYIESRKIKTKPAWLRINDDKLILRISKTDEAIEFQRSLQHINYSLLSKICIIGKGGLSINNRLENSNDAFVYAWAFGASGVEADISIATDDTGDEEKEYLMISSEDKLSSNAAKSDAVDFTDFISSLAVDYHLQNIYFDIRSFRYEAKDKQRELIERLFSDIHSKLDSDLDINLYVNGYDDDVADNIFNSRFFESALKEYQLEDRVSWIAEWSEERPRFYLRNLKRKLASGKRVILDAIGRNNYIPPSAIAINISGIEGINLNFWKRLTRTFNKNFSAELLTDIRQDIIFYTIESKYENVNLLIELLRDIDYFNFNEKVLGIKANEPHHLVKYLAFNSVKIIQNYD